MPALYTIASEIAAILEGNEDGELSAEDSNRLATIEMAFEKKVEGVLQFRQSLVSDAEAIGDEIQRLKARQDAILRRAEWMKYYVKQAMEGLGVSKVSTPIFSASIAKSPPRVEIEDLSKIPIEYQRTKVIVDPDKAALLQAYKDGKPLPEGVTVTQGTNLRIS